MAGLLIKPPTTAIVPLPVRQSQIRGVEDGGWFGPLEPMRPTAPAGTQPRQRDYEPGSNLIWQPRAQEAISFQDLCYMADNCDLVRIVIEDLKDQLCLLDWQIRVTPKPGETKKQTSQRQQSNPKVGYWTNFFKYPNPEHTWKDFLRMALEDLFVLDAPSILLQRTVGGQLGALRVIDGQTINRVIDEQGFTPQPPNPAYQQILIGQPAVNLTTDDLVYRPRVLRARKAYGFSPVEQILTTLNIAVRRMRFQLNYYCYSADTEVLTKRGWLRFSETASTDEFATRRINSGLFEWQRATEHFQKHYDGDMIHFENRSLDLLVTPNHRMLVDSLPRALGKKPASNSEQVVLAEDLLRTATKNTRIPQSSVWFGREIRSVSFQNKSDRSRRVSMTGDQYCAFMGMYLAEGSVKKNSNGELTLIQIHQPKDERGSYDLYAQLLTEIFGSAPYHSGKAFELSRDGLARFLKQFGHAEQKFIPANIRAATPRQLEIFWRYYFAGDGAQTASATQQAFTASKRLADQLTEIIQKMGSSATAYYREPSAIRLKDRVIQSHGGWIISRGVRQYTKAWRASRVEYHGDVCCVVVPNKFLYVRRNGKAAWCGNTEGNMPEALYTMPASVTEDQTRRFQQWFDTQLTGDLAKRRRIWFIPGDDKGASRLHWTKEALLKDEADEWFARIVCKAFRISPAGFIKILNRATNEESQNQAEEQGVRSVSEWIEETLNYIIQKKAGDADIEFGFTRKKEADLLKQAQTDKIVVDSGIKTRNEVRTFNGDDPSDDPMADKLGITTAQGFVLLDSAERQQQMAEQQYADAQASGKATFDQSNKNADRQHEFNEKQGDREHELRQRDLDIKEQQAKAKPASKLLKGAASWALVKTDDDSLVQNNIDSMQSDVDAFFTEAANKAADAVQKHVDAIQKAFLPHRLVKASDDQVDEIVDIAMVAIDWDKLVGPVQQDLFAAGSAGASVAIGQLHVSNVKLISSVSEAARDYAKHRAAELVGKQWRGNKLVDNPNASYRIDKTTRDEIRALVTKAFEEETRLEDLAEAIRKAGTFSESRAKTIARTEITKAQSTGQLDVWKASKLVKTVQWDTSADHDQMDECDLNRDAGPVEIGKPFPSGAVCPPAHPNCRCSLVVAELAEE